MWDLNEDDRATFTLFHHNRGGNNIFVLRNTTCMTYIVAHFFMLETMCFHSMSKEMFEEKKKTEFQIFSS